MAEFDVDDYRFVFSDGTGASIELSGDQLIEQGRFEYALNAENPKAALVSGGFCTTLEDAVAIERRARLVWAQVACHKLLSEDRETDSLIWSALGKCDREPFLNGPHASALDAWRVFKVWRLVTLACRRLPFAWQCSSCPFPGEPRPVEDGATNG